MKLLALLLALNAHAEEPDTWKFQWQQCQDITRPSLRARLPALKKLVDEGKAWQTRVDLEKLRIDQVTTVTCAKWAADPNGDTALREFVSGFSQVASGALDAKAEVLHLDPELRKWEDAGEAEAKQFRLSFSHFLCGQAFARTHQHMQEELHVIEAKLGLLRARCPRAADQIIEEAQRNGLKAVHRAKGESAPARVPASGTSPKTASSITGIEEDQAKSAGK